jgi:hypothetical protein
MPMQLRSKPMMQGGVDEIFTGVGTGVSAPTPPRPRPVIAGSVGLKYLALV